MRIAISFLFPKPDLYIWSLEYANLLLHGNGQRSKAVFRNQ